MIEYRKECRGAAIVAPRHLVLKDEAGLSMKSVISNEAIGKVPQVTRLVRIIKIAATTLDETGGDIVSVSMGPGYLVGTLRFILAPLLLVASGKVWRCAACAPCCSLISDATIAIAVASSPDRIGCDRQQAAMPAPRQRQAPIRLQRRSANARPDTGGKVR